MDLLPGLLARVELTVAEHDTAQALGSGDVPVLGTPRVLALVEAASVAVTGPRLDPGTTTVGVTVTLEHLVAVPVGARVVAEAMLAGVEGNRLTFEVSVRSGDEVIAQGGVVRVVVTRDRFVAKAYAT